MNLFVQVSIFSSTVSFQENHATTIWTYSRHLVWYKHLGSSRVIFLTEDVPADPDSKPLIIPRAPLTSPLETFKFLASITYMSNLVEKSPQEFIINICFKCWLTKDLKITQPDIKYSQLPVLLLSTQWSVSQEHDC